MTMSRVVLFVGERRSPTAIRMGVTWMDGRLAAKQLFDALDAIKFPRECALFANAYEKRDWRTIVEHRGPIVAMGQKAQKKLLERGIEFTPMVHPAARGSIRLKANYAAHVREVILQVFNAEV